MWSVLLSFHPRRKYLSFVLANSAPCTCFPLRLSPLRGPLPGSSIAWCFSGNSTKVTVFPKNTWTDTPLSSFPLPFVCPFLCLVVIFYFIYLFFFHSFTNGVTLANFHSLTTFPVRKDKLKIAQSGLQIASLTSLSILG